MECRSNKSGEYQLREQTCGCSMCARHIPSVDKSRDSEYKKESRMKNYMGPIILSALITGIAVMQSCYSSASTSEHMSSKADLAARLP